MSVIIVKLFFFIMVGMLPKFEENNPQRSEYTGFSVQASLAHEKLQRFKFRYYYCYYYYYLCSYTKGTQI